MITQIALTIKEEKPSNEGGTQEKAGRTRQELEETLTRLGVKDLSTAQEAHQAYSEQVNKIKALEADLAEILEGQTFEELQAIDQQVPAPPRRASAAAALELGELRQKIAEADRKISAQREQLAAWQEAFQSLDDLLEKLGEVHAEVKKAEAELETLQPLPPEVSDVEAFISEFEAQEELLAQKDKEWQDLLVERAELQGRAPGSSVEDISVQLREAERVFEETRQTGEALVQIQEAFAAVKAEMDGQTLTPWFADLRQYVAALTAGRYVNLNLSEREPGEAVRHDGLQLPSLLLSAGAKVSFGLAVRLSMAAHFLRNLKGFLVLDDPLVDLDDAGRQQAAVRVIEDFAKEKQVIVLTCKEAHADLLAGHRINLHR